MTEDNKILISPDALITMLVTEAEARELEELQSIEESEEEFRPSEKFQRQMEELLQQASRKSGGHRLWKKIEKCVASIAVAVSLFTFIMLPVENVRNAVGETLLDWQEKFVEIVFTKSPGVTRTLPTIDILYVPDGFELTEPANIRRDSYYAIFRNPIGDEYSLRAVVIENKQNIATDNEFTSYSSIKIDEKEFIWGILKDGSQSLVWKEKGVALQITGDIDLTEMINISEGLLLSENKN